MGRYEIWIAWARIEGAEAGTTSEIIGGRDGEFDRDGGFAHTMTTHVRFANCYEWLIVPTEKREIGKVVSPHAHQTVMKAVDVHLVILVGGDIVNERSRHREIVLDLSEVPSVSQEGDDIGDAAAVVNHAARLSGARGRVRWVSLPGGEELIRRVVDARRARRTCQEARMGTTEEGDRQFTNHRVPDASELGREGGANRRLIKETPGRTHLVGRIAGR